MGSSKKILILSDGKLGHQNQSIRLAECLNVDYDILKLDRRKFSKLLSFFSPIYIVRNFAKLEQAFANNNYSAVIGIGTVPRLAMVYLKNKYPNLKTIVVMDPKSNYEKYDVIIAPNHDSLKYKGDNVINVTGSLSYFQEADFAKAKADFAQEFFPLIVKPLIGLIIGGNSKGYSFTQAKTKDLLDKTFKVAEKLDSKIYATTSRRTPLKQTEYIKNRILNSGNKIYVSGDNNPYRAILAYSSILIVTPETVSMLMEACSTNALVLISDRFSIKSKRIQNFIQELIDKGLLLDLDVVYDMEQSQLIEFIKNKKPNAKFNELEKAVEFIKIKTNL
jgi:uncharacterized protein